MKNKIIEHLPDNHPWQKQIFWFDVIDSTNNYAKALAMEGVPHGTVIIADRQTGGRGRLGRSFHSPGGMGIYMSIILRYPGSAERLMHLTCAMAVAMCDAVEQAVGLRPGIKWTNDLVHEKRKLAGILTELVTLPEETAAIVGIGINCNQTAEDFPPDIRSFAGSLSMATGETVDRARLASYMIRAVYDTDQYLFDCREELLQSYKEDCITLGQEISLVRGEEVRHGEAVDLERDGSLLVRLPDGTLETVSSGEVSIRGMYGYV